MSSWFSRMRAPKPSTDESERIQLPEDLWSKCPGCAAIIYSRELSRNFRVCPKCGFHFTLSAAQRVSQLCDRGSFKEFDVNLETNDPLKFRDSKRYVDRLKEAKKKVGISEAVKTGQARLNGHPVMLGVFDPYFIGGSMGSVVGEKLTRVIEMAVEEKCPVVIVSSSGGARMQEGIYSLMQMVKVTQALVCLSKLNIPYISILAHPTTGGVAASFAMLGDINIAEPGSLIGFAGPRVIEQTIKRKLPEGFQRAEFLLEHGMVDLIVTRDKIKETIVELITMLTANNYRRK